MSNLIQDLPIGFAPNPAGYGPKADSLTIRTVTITGNLVVSGTINSQPIVGNVVSADAVQTMTNKTLSDTTTAIAAAGDSTVKVKILAAGSTGTTATLKFVNTTSRVYTVPDAAIDSSVVITSGNQAITGTKTFSSVAFSAAATLDGTNLTVSNLTIAAATNSVAVGALSGQVAVANGGTGAGSLTAHGVVVGNGTGAVNVTAVGSSGQVLTSNGPGLNPTFQAASGTNVTTKGDLQTFSTVATRLPVGSNKQLLMADSTQTTGLLWIDAFDPQIYVRRYDDFLGVLISGSNLTSIGPYNIGNITSTTPLPGRPGLITNTTITAPSVSSIGCSSSTSFTTDDPVGTATGDIDFECFFKINTLSDGVNTYNFRIGFFSNQVNGAADPTDGAFVSYSSALNTGIWELVTSRGGVQNRVSTGQGANTGWNRFGVRLNSGGSTVTFLLSGSASTTSVTDIPTTGVGLIPAINIAQSAGTLGQGGIYIDAIYIVQKLVSR